MRRTTARFLASKAFFSLIDGEARCFASSLCNRRVDDTPYFAIDIGIYLTSVALYIIKYYFRKKYLKKLKNSNNHSYKNHFIQRIVSYFGLKLSCVAKFSVEHFPLVNYPIYTLLSLVSKLRLFKKLFAIEVLNFLQKLKAVILLSAMY